MALSYIDLGITSAKQFWIEIVRPDYETFIRSQTARDAVHAALSTWHRRYWIFCEQPPGTDEAEFEKKLICDCPQLGWIRDYAETAKHRGLRRARIDVKSLEPDALVRSAQPVGGGFAVAVTGRSAVT